MQELKDSGERVPSPPASARPSDPPLPEAPTLAGKSVLVELEESLNFEADLKLRDLASGEAKKAEPPVFRPRGSRYQTLGLIGTGGMGTVYLAYDHDLKRRVAIKVLNPRAILEPQ